MTVSEARAAFYKQYWLSLSERHATVADMAAEAGCTKQNVYIALAAYGLPYPGRQG